MIEPLLALAALNDTGSVNAAALRLRLTASAVSKRIQTLEARVGEPLTEPWGRRVRLTERGLALLEETGPHLAALSDALTRPRSSAPAVLRVAASHSLLASWLPEALATAQQQAGVNLSLRVHRGVLVRELVYSGQVDVAICAGPGVEPELVVTPLGEEPMCVVWQGDRPRDARIEEVLSIEPQSLTGAWLSRKLSSRGIAVTQTLESFAGIVQLARAGFGDGVAPEPLARLLGVRAAHPLGLARPIVALTRPRSLQRSGVPAFLDAIKQATPAAMQGTRAAR